MIKFVGFYQTQEWVYQQMEQRYGKQKSDFSDTEQLGITFGCGYWAGIFCAIATQPMDNLVSIRGIVENRDRGWSQMTADLGANDLFMKGLGTRIIMIGTLMGLQWCTYLSRMPFISALLKNCRKYKLRGRNVPSVGVVKFLA